MPPWSLSPFFLANTSRTRFKNQLYKMFREGGLSARLNLHWSTPFTVVPLSCQRLVWRWSCDLVVANELWEASLCPSCFGCGCLRWRVVTKGPCDHQEKAKETTEKLTRIRQACNYQPLRFLRDNKPLLFKPPVVTLFPATKVSWFNNQLGKGWFGSRYLTHYSPNKS